MEVTICGATGLVGHELTLILGHLPELSKVKALSRKPLGRMPPKVETLILDFDKIETYSDALKADIFICCLGTTIKKAGSQANFEKVDFEYVLRFAKIAEACQAKKLLVISALGSDINSKFFYSQVKGRMEAEVSKLKIPQIEFFQPSLILGERKEKRIAEDLFKIVQPILNLFLIGPLKKYRGIQAHDIAKAMAIAALDYREGVYTYDSAKIKKIADQI